MLRFLLAPRWLAIHAALVLALAFCLVAGWWQWGVFQDSTHRQDQRGQAPVPISDLVRPGEEIGAAVDRAVTARGSYLNEHRLIIPGRIHDGVLGWFVLVPFQTDDGMVVPVLRGWVDDPAQAGGGADGSVVVTGHLLPPETADHATVRSDTPLEEDEIGYVAPDTLVAATGLAPAETLHGQLLLSSEEPPGADVAYLDIDEIAPIRDVSPWQNLSYTAQWWIFGLAAIAFWVSAVRSAVRSRRAADGGNPGDGDSPGNGATPGDGDGPGRVSERAAPHVPS